MTSAAFFDATTAHALPTRLVFTRGIEKEGLRMAQTGYAATTFHPAALGAKLTHPFITTDYSENLLELITPPLATIDAARAMLGKLHILVNRAINDELMWALSMPCMLADDEAAIPLADFGTSNIGKLKTLYRMGLAVRYGRKMQTIAGIHYNLSLDDDVFAEWAKSQNADHSTAALTAFKNTQYLRLIRNFKRLMPLILYLTGASPAVCACFVKDKKHNLTPLNNPQTGKIASFYAPFATSLRMGKLGYTNSVQDNLGIYYNDLYSYINALRQAIFTPYTPFSAQLDAPDGTPLQINDHILQIENEFYSPIRPKQVTKNGETPTEALEARGIAYIEFRAIDLDPYDPIGLSSETAHFLEILAAYCLFGNDDALEADEERLIAAQIDAVATNGRAPDFKLITKNGELLFQDWMMAHLTAMRLFAQRLDASGGAASADSAQTNSHQKALHHMQQLAQNPDLTPSAKLVVLCTLKEGISSFQLWPLPLSVPSFSYLSFRMLSFTHTTWCSGGIL